MTKDIGMIQSGVNARQRGWREPLWLAAGAGGLVFLLGVVFLAGWILRNSALTGGQAGASTISPAGALAYTICGAGLAAAALRRGNWAMLCGSIGALLGAVNLAGHLLGFQNAVNRLLFALLRPNAPALPGGTPPHAALQILMAGVGILAAISPLPVRWKLLVLTAAGTLVAFAGLFARIGYIGQSGGAWDVSFFPGLSGFGVLGFILLGAGLIVLGIYGNEGSPSQEAPASVPGLRSLASISPANLLLPLLGSGLLLGSIGIFIVGHQQSQKSEGAVRRTLDVITTLGLVESATLGMQTEARGFVITGQEELLTAYRQASREFDEALSAAKGLTSDNPAQQEHLKNVLSLRAQWGSWAESVIAVRRSAGGAQKTQPLVAGGLGAELMKRLKLELDLAQDVELRLLAERKSRESASQTVLTITLLFCVVGGIVVGMTQFWLARKVELQRQALVSEVATRKEVEESLKRANASYEAVNKELEAFAYSVSHDLRAPIRGMAGFSQILIEDFGPQLPPEAQDHLRVIQAEGQRMGQLIDDMLNLSRVTRTEMKREPVNLSALAEEVLATLRRAAPERTVECVVTDGLTATGDMHLLRILMDNLLGNAWKFTGRTAEPRIEFGSVSGDKVPAFYVRDNGAGFDMAYADKLFSAFQRLHSANEFPGTGIGLAIVQRIANRHGGRAWAEGAQGHGATFYFSL